MKRNSRFEIHGPRGWCKFDGIRRKKSSSLLKIVFEDGAPLVCTRDHRFFIDGKFIQAAKVQTGKEMNGRVVHEVVPIDESMSVYDPVNVADGNAYIADCVVNHNCSFVGSSKTLIDGDKIAQIPFIEPLHETTDNLKMYEASIQGHSYVCAVDVSRGQHLDSSAFIIYDVTVMPYKIVATFKNNTISTLTYPFMIINTCKAYNDAYCLVEINDAGGEVANSIFYDSEYANVYWTHKDDLVEGLGYPGVRSTKRVKGVGCSVLKELVEQNQLIVNSYDIINEMNNFIAKGASYAADDTQINDDLMTCLWLFAWLTKQPMFADITNTNIRAVLNRKYEDSILESLIPFGYITDGTEESADPVTHLDQMRTPDPMKDWLLG